MKMKLKIKPTYQKTSYFPTDLLTMQTTWIIDFIFIFPLFVALFIERKSYNSNSEINQRENSVIIKRKKKKSKMS